MAKEKKIKLDLKPTQIFLLLDELEQIKTSISIRSNEAFVISETISDLIDSPNRYTETFNQAIEAFERKYREYQSKYDAACQLGVKIGKKEKLHSFELYQLLTLFEDFSFLSASHPLDYLEYEEKLPVAIKIGLDKRSKSTIERNASLNQIIEHLKNLNKKR